LLAVSRFFEREQLEPVAPRIRGVEAAYSGERVVPLDALAGCLEPLPELLELGGRETERGMCLSCRRERLLDADVELSAAVEREPDAAACAQFLGLLHFREAEEVAEEPSRLRLAAGRRRELNVI
jgi:hypothetical protein